MNELQPLLDLLGAKHGWVAAVVAWIGALRLALKPFGAAVAGFIAAAVEFSRVAGPGEVSWLDRVMHSPSYRLLAFLVDYLASVKLPLHAGDRHPTVPPVALVAALAGAGLLVGCATLQQAATPERVRAVAALAGYTSCMNDTRGRPIERGKWVQVVGGLKTMVDAGQWDGVTVAQALERAGISEVVCEEGQVAISGGLAFLDMFTGILQRAESAPIVRAVAEGMLDGIGQALDQSAGSRRNDLADLTARAQATRPRKRRAGRVKAAALVGLLACTGCASVKMESHGTKFDPKTGIVSTNDATAKVFAVGGGKAIVESLRASSGATASVGAKGVDSEANMQWVVDLMKLMADTAKAVAVK